MADLEPRRSAVHPVTGEVLDLGRLATDELAEALNAVQTVSGQLKETKAAVDAEMLQRFDQAARWTVHVPGFKLSAPSPARRVDYDVGKLASTLDELVTDGSISTEARDSALEVEVVTKPKVAGLNALKKLGGRVEAAILACETYTTRARSVRLERDR
jgi:hypothetical protein